MSISCSLLRIGDSVRVPDDRVGNTPLVLLEERGKARIWCKLDHLNPTGSIKDRPAVAMLDAAKLAKGSTVIESSSGNLAVALARVCAMRELEFTAVIPPNDGLIESRLDRYGAKFINSNPGSGPRATRDFAEAIADQYDCWLDQYSNPANPACHYYGTGPEIIKDCPQITHFLAGAGSGGTLTGAGKAIKEYNPEVQIIAVTSAVQGLRGDDPYWQPAIAETEHVSNAFNLSVSAAELHSRHLLRTHGIEAGFSTGAAWAAASSLARYHMTSGADIVFIATDRLGQRTRKIV